MTDTPFAKYINREGIFLERNLVIFVRLVATTPLASSSYTGVDFELLALADLRDHSGQHIRLPFELGAIFDVGSTSIEDYDGVLQAIGYVTWALVFEEQLKRRILDQARQHIDFRWVRQLLEDALMHRHCLDSTS